MIKYVTKKDGINTEYEFVLSDVLPKDKLVSTPLSFAFIGKNLVLVQKQNDWWDIVGGKIEDSENWEDALKREAREEAGIIVDHIEIVGYVLAKSNKSGRFPAENILPVTMSFVKKVLPNNLAPDVKKREAFEKTEVVEVLKERGDSGQLLEIFEYVLEHYENQGHEYEFEYVKAEEADMSHLQATQAMVFVRDEEGKFIAVRDEDEEHYSLPGGGCCMDEKGGDCAVREVREEAQCEIDNLRLLGNVVVRVKKNGEILSESRQFRYLATLTECDKFDPRNVSEISERKFVDLDFLYKNTRILNNDTGKSILEDLKNKL